MDEKMLVEPTDQEAWERYLRELPPGARELTAQAPPLPRTEEEEQARALIQAIHQEALERSRWEPRPASDPPGIHYTQLPDPAPGSELTREWNTYRREVGRLLAEGHEGRHILIKGEEIVGIFETDTVAYREGLNRYLGESFFVHPIRTFEPILRMRGYNLPWPS